MIRISILRLKPYQQHYYCTNESGTINDKNLNSEIETERHRTHQTGGSLLSMIRISILRLKLILSEVKGSELLTYQ